jgi:hypothetical protein
MSGTTRIKTAGTIIFYGGMNLQPARYKQVLLLIYNIIIT